MGSFDGKLVSFVKNVNVEYTAKKRESTNVFIVFFLFFCIFPLISVFFGTGAVSSNEIDKTNELLVRKNIYFTVDKRG